MDRIERNIKVNPWIGERDTHTLDISEWHVQREIDGLDDGAQIEENGGTFVDKQTSGTDTQRRVIILFPPSDLCNSKERMAIPNAAPTIRAPSIRIRRYRRRSEYGENNPRERAADD